MNFQTLNFKVGKFLDYSLCSQSVSKARDSKVVSVTWGKLARPQDAEDFLRDARKQLCSIHPHLYITDGAVRG